MGSHGTLGLIATNTIGQGDTRATGLQWLVDSGAIIYGAVPNMPWPGDAAVTVSVVHTARGISGTMLRPRYDGRDCRFINSSLQPGQERTAAAALEANASAAYLGTKIYGQGFLLTPEERTELSQRNRRNAARIFPYLGGEEVNSSPTQDFHRYVISFGTVSLEEAEEWPDLLRIVRETVKPERDKNKRDNYRLNWWLFGEVRPGLFEAIAPLERCLVTSRHSKHLSFSFQPTDRIFSEALYVFPLDHHTAFATLQSRIHEPWARLLSSSLEDRLRYAASDCFETFPFPHADPRAQIPELEQAGQALYEARAKFMVETNQGLTKTYNALKDPNNHEREIRALRELHEAMDRAVLHAYGWQDLQVPAFCPKTPSEQAELKRFEAEVIDRLYALNAERAAEEARLGLTKPKKGTKASAKRSSREQQAQRALKPLSKASPAAANDTSKSRAPKPKPKHRAAR